jgi:hypothetical protein
MEKNTLEIWFVDGFFKGQVWTMQNLDIKDLLYHYEHLPIVYLRESIIYVRTGKKRILMNDFLENYYYDKKNQSHPSN